MMFWYLIFSIGIAVGIIITLIALQIVKKIGLVKGLKIVCVLFGTLGFTLSIAGVWFEKTKNLNLGLWLIVLGAMMMALCGVFATLFSKYQTERIIKTREKQQIEI